MFQAQNIAAGDPTHGWDGRFRGRYVQPAVFTWYAEVEFTDGTVELFSGDVTVAR